jgi:diguanylate cyclase (GGDEF)-like protein/PAS domain S-box-containing protein
MTALRIAAAFLMFGVAWILLSDRMLEAMVANHDVRATIQSIKGIVFVLLSTTLVYLLVRAAERRHAALDAQATRERDRLAQVLNVNPAVVYSLRVLGDGSGRFVVDFVGPNVVKVTGHPPDHWLDTPTLWLDNLHPDDRSLAQTTQLTLLAQGEVSYEYRFRHADGSYRWIHDQLVLLRTDSGQPTQILGAWLDVTDRRLAEATLLASEERYRLLFESNPMPMWLLDTATFRFLSVNHAALETYGYTESEFLALTLDALRPPHEVERMRTFLARLSPNATYPSHAGDWLHQRKDGSEFWVEIVRHSVDHGGRPCQLVLAQDISARKQADEHRRVIAQVFDTSQEGIFITDAHTRFISVNQSFTRITGYSTDDVAGQTPRILSSGRQNKAFYQSMWAAIEADGRWEGEIWNRRKTGEIYPEWLVISAIKDASNQVRQYLGIFTETSSRKEAEARILRLVNYDNLTNLPNRALLFDRARVAIASATRNQTSLAVLHLNVDHFKHINESFGHDAGDEVLTALSQRLTAHIKPEDTVSRLGADNFIVLLLHTSAVEAGKVALRLMGALSEAMSVAEHKLNPTVSVGIATFPHNGTDLLKLMQAAEAAVDLAKREGRNTVRFFTPALHEQLQATLAIERDLQHAVTRGQLVLHYQPQVDVRTRQIVGTEALVRWQHPEWGLVPPARFIPVAEQTGLIRPIGEWVLKQALADTAAWLAAGLPVVPVAVNLSVVQFRHEGLQTSVLQALQTSGLPPGLLELELTESVAMEDSEFTVTTINALKSLGVKLSIDDFGTGYSSLSYLKRFAVDKLKIDQSFVRGLNHDAEDEAIVTAVISLANSLGLHTIAEGVETEEQAAFLKASGCNEFQGYLFSKPVPAEALAALLASGAALPIQAA